jgi:hypothetical protein
MTGATRGRNARTRAPEPSNTENSSPSTVQAVPFGAFGADAIRDARRTGGEDGSRDETCAEKRERPAGRPVVEPDGQSFRGPGREIGPARARDHSRPGVFDFAGAAVVRPRSSSRGATIGSRPRNAR